MRLMASGPCEAGDYAGVFDEFDRLHSQTPLSAVLTGCKSSLSVIAIVWAQAHCVKIEDYPLPYWDDVEDLARVNRVRLLNARPSRLIVTTPGGIMADSLSAVALMAGVPVQSIRTSLGMRNVVAIGVPQ